MKRIAITLSILAAATSLYAQEYITYEQFGAVGDGIHDDMDAIVAAHEAANAKGLPVRAGEGRTYYIGGAAKTAVIRTDTDFGRARFIIDDRDVENKRTNVFEVKASAESFEVKDLQSLKSGARSLDVRLPGKCLLEVVNGNRRVYIRKGLNQNNGTAQREMLLASRSGRISRLSPVIWDYDTITALTAYPVDKEKVTVKGGIFTTIANNAPSAYTYYNRGISVKRSNTLVEGITHYVEGEGDHGAPYNGFISVDHCTGVTLKDMLFTARKTYVTNGSAGKPVSMGSYDLTIGNSVDVKVIGCRQTTDLDDRAYWGLMGSNFCKSIAMEGCSVSRFDAHQGVVNVTLRDCVFGHMYTRAVGSGTMRLERCEVRSGILFSLRDDYGSTWDGDVIVKDCILHPVDPKSKRVVVIGGSNDGTHDFGYPCRLPRRIVIDGLTIDDSVLQGQKDYDGPNVFDRFYYSPDATVPYTAEGVITARRVTVASGKPFTISRNPERFAAYKTVGL